MFLNSGLMALQNVVKYEYTFTLLVNKYNHEGTCSYPVNVICNIYLECLTCS